jgi:hypothetical protein
VLGLYLHVAYMTFMATFEERVGRGEITPRRRSAPLRKRRLTSRSLAQTS